MMETDFEFQANCCGAVRSLNIYMPVWIFWIRILGFPTYSSVQGYIWPVRKQSVTTDWASCPPQTHCTPSLLELQTFNGSPCLLFAAAAATTWRSRVSSRTRSPCAPLMTPTRWLARGCLRLRRTVGAARPSRSNPETLDPVRVDWMQQLMFIKDEQYNTSQDAHTFTCNFVYIFKTFYTSNSRHQI